MADTQFQSFDERMDRILRNHEQLSRGYVRTVTRDGLIVARPRRRPLAWLPWRSVLCLLVAGMALKVLIYVNLGPAAYEERVARLAAGTEIEQVGAYLLTADTATLWLADRVRDLTP